MRKIFSNTWFLVLVAVFFTFCNIYLGTNEDSYHWFQRSGSIVVIIGILIIARRPIRLGKEYRNEDWNLPDDSPEGKDVLMDDRSEFIIGPVVALVGTLIWGYGDLILPYLLELAQ